MALHFTCRHHVHRHFKQRRPLRRGTCGPRSHVRSGACAASCTLLPIWPGLQQWAGTRDDASLSSTVGQSAYSGPRPDLLQPAACSPRACPRAAPPDALPLLESPFRSPHAHPPCIYKQITSIFSRRVPADPTVVGLPAEELADLVLRLGQHSKACCNQVLDVEPADAADEAGGVLDHG